MWVRVEVVMIQYTCFYFYKKVVCLLGGHYKTYGFLIGAFLVFRYSSFARILTWNCTDTNPSY